MEHGVARLNDSALGNIDQLAAHEVHESARNVGGALRKHVRRQGCAVKGKEMKSSAERLSYRDAVELGSIPVVVALALGPSPESAPLAP